MFKRNVFLLLLLCWPLLTTAQKKQGLLPVKVTLNMIRETDQKNLILYNRDQPLKIRDFRGKPDAASYGVGATYSGIFMEMEGSVQHDVLEITVSLTVYFDQTKSWMKEEGKNERVLAHEQNHFDLTAIKACALAKAIGEEKFTSDNVRDRLRALQQTHTKELNELQQAYDKETQHGTIRDKQEEWSARIAKGLAASTCI